MAWRGKLHELNVRNILLLWTFSFRRSLYTSAWTNSLKRYGLEMTSAVILSNNAAVIKSRCCKMWPSGNALINCAYETSSLNGLLFNHNFRQVKLSDKTNSIGISATLTHLCFTPFTKRWNIGAFAERLDPFESWWVYTCRSDVKRYECIVWVCPFQFSSIFNSFIDLIISNYLYIYSSILKFTIFSFAFSLYLFPCYVFNLFEIWCLLPGISWVLES